MRKLIKIVIFLVLTTIMSCEGLYMYNCGDCLITEPTGAYLKIELDYTFADDQAYHVSIYKGKIEDNIIIDERDTHGQFSIWVYLNQEYSAVSSFIVDGVEYRAISATSPKAIDNQDYCDELCYIVIDNEIDLRLKYN